MLAFILIVEGSWSIADLAYDEDGEEIHMWCGERHRWVRPTSPRYGVNATCWPQEFTSLDEAQDFAKAKGWSNA